MDGRGSSFIVVAGLLRRRSRYGNARRQTENGIYARNRGWRTARVIRRIDRLVFVPGRNLFPPPRLAFFFFLVFRRTRTTIDTWRGRRWSGRREREPRSATGGEKARGRKDGRGVGRVAPHILLISVSIVVSVGTPSLRARGAAKGGEGPSIILSSVSLTSHSLSLLLFIFLPFAPRAGRFRSLAFAASTILENARDNDVVSVETGREMLK